MNVTGTTRGYTTAGATPSPQRRQLADPVLLITASGTRSLSPSLSAHCKAALQESKIELAFDTRLRLPPGGGWVSDQRGGGEGHGRGGADDRD